MSAAKKKAFDDMKRPAVALFFLILRIAVAGVFIVAGASKTGNPAKFLDQILTLGFIPYPVAYLAALYLPWVEIVAGVMLLTLRFTCAASVLLILLTASFISILSIAHVAGTQADCGCFGVWFTIGNYWVHLIIDVAIIAALVFHLSRSFKLTALFEKDR
jgi:uncharacterized membrane protein YphA (DoxX/SURF4 family)